MFGFVAFGVYDLVFFLIMDLEAGSKHPLLLSGKHTPYLAQVLGDEVLQHTFNYHYLTIMF